MEKSLFNNTKGDSYRVGGVDTDNLYPAYTNPVGLAIKLTGLKLTIDSHLCELSSRAGPVAVSMIVI
jgi:hypothetical protein